MYTFYKHNMHTTMCLDIGHDLCWVNPEATHFADEIQGIRWIGDGAARHNGYSSYATIGVAVIKLCIAGIFERSCNPDWEQELKAVSLAIRWHCHLRFGAPRPPTMKGNFPNTMRNLVEYSLRP